MMAGMPGPAEMLLIFLAILLLFGAKRIPEIAQGLGRGIRDFKKAMRDTEEEVTSSAKLEEKAPSKLEHKPSDESKRDLSQGKD